MANKGFTGPQKQYLEGLASGLRVARGTTRSILADLRARIAPVSPAASAGAANGAPSLLAQATHPDQAMWDAQDRQLRAGSRLAPEERAKRRQPPHELWARMAELAREQLASGASKADVVASILQAVPTAKPDSVKAEVRRQARKLEQDSTGQYL